MLLQKYSEEVKRLRKQLGESERQLKETSGMFDDAISTCEEIRERVKELEKHLNYYGKLIDSDPETRDLSKFALEKKVEALEECVGVCGFLSCEDSLKARIKQLRNGVE